MVAISKIHRALLEPRWTASCTENVENLQMFPFICSILIYTKEVFFCFAFELLSALMLVCLYPEEQRIGCMAGHLIDGSWKLVFNVQRATMTVLSGQNALDTCTACQPCSCNTCVTCQPCSCNTCVACQPCSCNTCTACQPCSFHRHLCCMSALFM